MSEHAMCGYTGNKWGHWNSNKGLKKNVKSIPGKHSTDPLQQTTVLGTSHITRKVLQCES
jgi:hypothetical protein